MTVEVCVHVLLAFKILIEEENQNPRVQLAAITCRKTLSK